ncbi:MAG: hypothetical protein OXF11_09150 [Deltaproteobacteria bacterium]|nr:hypothetical protein [Deltaproteobacteria bacterium]
MRQLRWAIAILFVLLLAGQAAAQDVSFKGKTINLIVGSSPGGGYDLITRLFTKFAGKHFPGNPRFIVRNVPGGAGLKGTQYMNRSRPDGLTAGPHYTSLVMKELAGVDVPGFDVKELIIVGAPTLVDDDYVICGDRNIVKSWEDVLKMGRPLRFASQRPGIGRVPMGAEFMQLVGGPVRVIYGYKSTGEELAAFARGETEVVTCLDRRLPRMYPELIEKKRLVPLYWWNAPPDDAWVERLGGEKPYNILELPGVEISDAQKLAFTTAVNIHQHLRAFMLPPKTPQAIVDVWRKSFKATIEDPAFVKAANDAGYDVGYGSPEEYEKQLATINTLSPDGTLFFQQLMGEKR